MTKEEILATVEPRSIKTIIFHNSWGNSVGSNGFQILTEDHFTAGCIKECGVIYDTAAYQHSPSAIAKPLSWIQIFLSWFTSFAH